MELPFTVGDEEKHDVLFTFDQWWGRLRITVDGRPVVNTIRIFSFNPTPSWTFVVGLREKHEVRIVKRREILFGGLRPQTVTAFVDGRPVAEGRSDIS